MLKQRRISRVRSSQYNAVHVHAQDTTRLRESDRYTFVQELAYVYALFSNLFEMDFGLECYKGKILKHSLYSIPSSALTNKIYLKN